MKGLVFEFLAAILYYTGITPLLLFLEDRFGWKRMAIAVCYHNIEPQIHEQPISQMEKGTWVNVFKTHLALFSRWLQGIDDRQLCDWLEGNCNLASDSLLVTFDDGYRDNLLVAGPVLMQFNLPGITFIATQYIDSSSRFWWIRLSDVMRQITPENWKTLIQRSVPDEIKSVVQDEDLLTWESRVRARRQIALVIDRADSADDLLQHLENEIQINYRHAENKPMKLLSWNEIRAMDSNGFCIGGHTHTHPHLSRVSDECIKRELDTCHGILKHQLRRPPCSFAYPAGDFDDRVVAHLNASPFRVAFTTRPGIITQQSNPFCLPRLYLSRKTNAGLSLGLLAFKITKYFKRVEPLAIRFACSKTVKQ